MSAKNVATVEERVRRGAMLLDSEIPGWADRINIPRLDMSGCAACVIGQILGDYWRGCRTLSISARGATCQAAELGFHSSVDPPPLGEWTLESWKEASDAEAREYKALRAA